MPFSWSYKSLAIDADMAAGTPLEYFHESTKLYPRSSPPSESARLAPNDLFLMSRGFRQYSHAYQVDLPDPIPKEQPFRDVLLTRRSRRALSGAISLGELSTLLQVALGPTAILNDAELGITHVLRGHPSAGGLNSLDVYVICANVEGIRRGLYHFNAVRSQLELINQTDPVDLLQRAFFGQEFSSRAAACVLLVGVLDRLAEKYGEERSYRLALLDAGHACQNLLLAAEHLALNAVAIQGFCDDILAASVGVDSVREIVLHTMLTGKAT